MRGAGDAWTAAAELVTATAVWAGIGYGLDRLFHTWPILFAVGAVLGHGTGIYMVYRRFGAQTRAADGDHAAPVQRKLGSGR